MSSQLEEQAIHIVRRDVTPGFIATELIIWLNAHKIIRPGYTTLQELLSRVLSDERQRLERILTEHLDEPTIAELDKLIERDDTLSRLAVLRQDARDFGWRQMRNEREKRAVLEPIKPVKFCLYRIFLSKTFCIMPVWQISIPFTIFVI